MQVQSFRERAAYFNEMIAELIHTPLVLKQARVNEYYGEIDVRMLPSTTEINDPNHKEAHRLIEWFKATHLSQ